MNTNALKKFAQEARIKLMEQVGAKLAFVLNTDTPELREKSDQLRKLREALTKTTTEQLIDKVSYTWFNRFMALRFMDANDYQPLRLRVLTPKNGYTLPELLDEAKGGHIPVELKVKTQRIFDLLDGKIPSVNAQNEAYKELLIGACNYLSQIFPFLFERIDDYTELLIPDDLTSELSIIQNVCDGMTVHDCSEVEIIGWLYQFYISEKKDQLINAKKRYKTEEIPSVTQLFTPKWIVQYMVDNTLGQYWSEMKTETKLTKGLPYYIQTNNPELVNKRVSRSPEEIKFFDPCVGSAHILCYAFDVFFKIYEEEGYDPSIIPELILKNNLFGIDIDDRAAQLAGFALMMKGRKHNRRFFKKLVVPNVTAFQDNESNPKFANAKTLGSLIKVSQDDTANIIVNENSLFAETEIKLKEQTKLLADKYDIVVTNPPYLNSSYMDSTLKQFVDKEYKDTKSDLFACFLMQATNFTKEDGLIGFICPYVWMFIQSYEKLRTFIIERTTISSLVQLEYNAFGPAVVPIATFVLRNKYLKGYNGSYIKLSDFTGAENQAPKTLEAIKNPDCSWFYIANQIEFEKIPGNLIGYWISKNALKCFDKGTLSSSLTTREGMATAGNERFLRIWTEVSRRNSFFNNKETSGTKWYPYNKGGAFKRWYGNDYFFVNWENDGYEIRNNKDSATGRIRSHNYNGEYSFQKGITWTALTTGKFSARWTEEGYLFDSKGAKGFCSDSHLKIMGLLNSKIAQLYLDVLAPTLDYKVGDIIQIPYFNFDNSLIEKLVSECIEISKIDWDSRETSWGFKLNELIRIKGQDLEETYDLYQQYWKKKFTLIHNNEQEINKQFIEIFELTHELNPLISIEDISILMDETLIKDNHLVFKADEVFKQFMSYAVSCIFGRYSLDKEGLILANQGETLEAYLHKVEKTKSEVTFVPDEDNIIPVLDDEWFEDDITGRFYAFLKASFGVANFDKNLAFVEECLGKDVRKYFTKDFYADHIRRYKKRPIYWMFSSPKGSFNVLIYMHRYTPDTLNKILNNYLIEYREKLNNRIEHLDHLIVSGSSIEQTRSQKEKDRLKIVLIELQEYEREIIRPLAIERIAIDLDEGVLVNYNKFGKAIKEVAGLNDKATKKKVREFDWINAEEIR
jgi:type II restriction/modification system DNA methylase subunit YeeA